MSTPNLRRARLKWEGGTIKFTGCGLDPETRAVDIDPDNREAPGPMQLLLLAAASCAAVDVISILEKMRTPASSLEVEVVGRRRDAAPRRYEGVHLAYRLKGEGLDATNAERAVALSVEKYCSVVHSLAPDVEVTHEVRIQ